MSSSANSATVMSYLMQPGRPGYAFSVYYYDISLTPDRKYANSFGQVCSGDRYLFSELADVRAVDPQMPLLIVQAGRDFIPQVNEALDYFAAYVRMEGAQVTVIRYEEGEHGFDSQ
jgi:acetyl esterase/lipase